MKDEPDRPSKRLVMQRVHNRIMEHLELTSSFDAQREYQRNVPIADVPSEVMCIWHDDCVSAPIDAEHYPDPAFTQAERDAMAEYDRVSSDVCEATPKRLPPLEATLRLPQWRRLRDAAAKALVVFRVRGALPEDEEIAGS